MFSIPSCTGVIDGLIINMQQFSRWVSPSPLKWPGTTTPSGDGWEGEGSQAGRALGDFRHPFGRCWCTTLIFKLPAQALMLRIFKEKPLDSGEQLHSNAWQKFPASVHHFPHSPIPPAAFSEALSWFLKIFLWMIIFVQGSTWVEQLLSATVIYQEIFMWLSLQRTEALVRLRSSFKTAKQSLIELI